MQMRVILILLFLLPVVVFAQNFRKKYNGFIGPYPITMTLVCKNGNITGTYYYESFDDPISVRGFISGKSIRFHGYDLKGNRIDEFIGQVNKYDVNGIWIGEGMQKRFNFKLHEIYVPPTPLSGLLTVERIILGLLGLLAVVSLGVWSYIRFTKRVPNWLSRIELRYKRRFAPQRIGYEFERYMTDRLDPHKYRLVEWRKSSNKFKLSGTPGLVFERRFVKEGNNRLGIACKYFEKASDIFQIGTIENYFEKYRTLFIAIGVGGRPSAPESVYLIPIDKVKDNKISLKDISNFRIQGTTVEYDPTDNTFH
jgi:hypothetical protein